MFIQKYVIAIVFYIYPSMKFMYFILPSNNSKCLYFICITGFEDTGDYWLNGYTVTEKESSLANNIVINQDDFRNMVDKVWSEVMGHSRSFCFFMTCANVLCLFIDAFMSSFNYLEYIYVFLNIIKCL